MKKTLSDHIVDMILESGGMSYDEIIETFPDKEAARMVDSGIQKAIYDFRIRYKDGKYLPPRGTR